MKTFDVTFQREDHQDALKDWVLVDDVCAGERRIKHKKDTYLPKPNPLDESKENQTRYEELLKRAVFYNATGRTLKGLVGTVYKKQPSMVLPTELEFLRNDVNGKGVNLIQQSQRCTRSVVKKGRHALFVDYPVVEGTKTKEEIKRENIRPNIVSISAENVPNWRVEQIGGVYKFTLVVIEEKETKVTSDGFGQEIEDRFRVLKLVDNVYTVEVYKKNESGEWVQVGQSYEPTDGNGKKWSEIPFTFVGADNNDDEIDQSPILDLATLNVAHYRNSAWYEDNVFYIGQAQPVMTGLTEEWRDHLEANKVEIGSSTILMLPEGGDFKFAQVGENPLVKEAMDQKEEQMKALGARVLQKGEAVKTATEAQSENESEHSPLSLIASNVSEAYEKALNWAALYMNVSGEIIFELNQDYLEHSLDAQMLTALIAAWQAGRLPSSDYWNLARKYGLVDPEKTDEELDEEAENSDAGLGLDDEPVFD